MNQSVRFDKWVAWLVAAILLCSAAMLISASYDGKNHAAASIVPSLSSLIVVNLVAVVLWRFFKHKQATQEAV